MQGILIVDKPAGWTSFDVIAKMRGVLGTRKLGHSGTLDPMATGVLPVFCGGASKAVDLQLDHDKTYRAVLRLGSRTDTGDVTGRGGGRAAGGAAPLCGPPDAGAAHVLGGQGERAAPLQGGPAGDHGGAESPPHRDLQHPV